MKYRDMKHRKKIALFVLCALLFAFCSACAETNKAQQSAPFQPAFFDKLTQPRDKVLQALSLSASDYETPDPLRVDLLHQKAEICGYAFTVELLFSANDGFMYGFRYILGTQEMSGEDCHALLQDISAALSEAYGSPKTVPMEGRIQDWSGTVEEDFDPERGYFDRWLVPGKWSLPGEADEDVILRAQLAYESQYAYKGAAYKGEPCIMLDFDLRVHKLVSYERKHGIAL